MGTSVIRICWLSGGVGGPFAVGQMVYIKWHQRECQQRAFLSRFHWSKIINVAHFSCYGPHCSGWLAAFAGCTRAAGLNSTVQLQEKSESEELVESCTLAKFELSFLFLRMFRTLLITFNLFLICIINPHYNGLTWLRILGQCRSGWLMNPLQ